jgi:hypothetical protein
MEATVPEDIEILRERIALLEATLEKLAFAVGQIAIGDEFRSEVAQIEFWSDSDI